MNKPHNSIDGFRPRRSGSQIGERHFGRPTRPMRSTSDIRRSSRPQPQGLRRIDEAAKKATSTERAPGLKPSAGATGLTRRDISESLNKIDELDQPLEPTKKRRRKRGERKPKKVLSKKRRIIKWTLIALAVIILAVGGYLAYKAINASNNIFKGNLLGLIQNQPLKEDANGRSNILILGTSEDDPDHPGAYLTDSMMVVSIHQKSNSAAMFSIPRDLYVDYKRACNSGYQGKINEYFNCVNSDWQSKEAQEQRMRETRKFIGDIFGLDIQYTAHVNNTVVKEAVDAVGGIKVDIQGSNGAPGILDRNFDWRCNYQCHLVKYDNGVHELDGKHALFLAMARGDRAPTYGLGNSNFDREQNQQKILVALKEKAVSAGTLSDVGKVTGLMDAFGDNLRTNFDTSEIRTLMQLGTDIKVENIQKINFYDEENPLVKSGNYNGASVVMPSAGVFNYSDIHAFLAQKLSNNPVTREGAKVAVLNGSGVAGVAQTEADKLTEAGYIVSQIGNAPEGDYSRVTIYQIGKGKTKTKEALEKRFKVTAKTTQPPVSVTGETNFVIIVGEDTSGS